MRIAGAALVAVLLVSGCSSVRRERELRSWQLAWELEAELARLRAAHAARRPELALTDDEIARAVAANAQLDAKRRELATLVVTRARGRSSGDVAQAVRTCYALGARAAAHALIGASPGICEWSDAEPLARVSCRFRSEADSGFLEVSVERRPGVEGPLAVAFPPGTFAAACTDEVAADDTDWTRPDDERRFGRWPSAQDLGFLRAPVLELREGEDAKTIRVEVACASFRQHAPEDGQPFTLDRFPEGSPEDALAVALCAGAPRPEAEAQLALWLARNDITWNEFAAEGGHVGRLVTFGSHRRIRAEQAEAAAQLLLESGTNPRTVRFFGGAGARRVELGGGAGPSSSDEIPHAEPVPSAEPIPSAVP